MSEIQALLDRNRAGAAEGQRVWWDYRAWLTALQQGPLAEITVPALEELEDRWAGDGGIARAAVADVGRNNAVSLLVASMAWGFGSRPYGPARTARMLATPYVAVVLAEIAEAAQAGAQDGFSALFRDGKARVAGLSIAMGSKLIYFAAGGLATESGDPLVYDRNVHWALLTLEGGWPQAPDPGKRMYPRDYDTYVSRIDGYAVDFGLSRSDVEVTLFDAATWLRQRRRLAEIEQRVPATLGATPQAPARPLR